MGMQEFFPKAQMKMEITYKTEASIVQNIKILIRFIRRLVSKKRIWYDAITFKEERYRVCGVSPLFVYTMGE